MLTSRRFLFLSAVLTLNAFAIGCSATTDEEDLESGEDAFSQQQVDNDPVLKALQQKASNVDQYEINVDAIAVPVANASVGADINGFSTHGLDWFKNPAVSYPNNKSWDQGSDTGKKCQWASIFRFQAIMSDPPAEALAMKNLDGGMWHGSFWSWTDDYASTNSVGQPTTSYAWSSGLWKWIAASGKDGLCRIPTKTMVKRMMQNCMEVAQANSGDPKGCRMPTYDPSAEPAPSTGDGGADGSTSASDAGTDASSTNDGSSSSDAGMGTD